MNTFKHDLKHHSKDFISTVDVFYSVKTMETDEDEHLAIEHFSVVDEINGEDLTEDLTEREKEELLGIIYNDLTS